AWIPLWRRGRTNPAALSLVTTTVAVGLVMFDPLVVGWLEPRLGYLLMRMIWIVPLAGVLAWVLPELWTRARTAEPGGRRGALVGLLGVLALAAPTVASSLEALARPGPIRDAE